MDNQPKITAQKFPYLFLDRDGVINKRIRGSYVRHFSEFEFCDNAKEAIALLNRLFDKIIVVTNQQGVAKKVMTESDLDLLHQSMQSSIEEEGGRIDLILASIKLATENSNCRKPNPGMAEQAQKQFPEIDFEKSIMVGDSLTDLQFGKRLNMKTIWITGKEEDEDLIAEKDFDVKVSSLYQWAKIVNA